MALATALLRSLDARPSAVDASDALSPDDLEIQTLAGIDAVAQQLSGDPAVRDGFDQAADRQAKLEGLRPFQQDRQAQRGDFVAASMPALPFADDSFVLVHSNCLLFCSAPVRDGGLMQEHGLDWTGTGRPWPSSPGPAARKSASIRRIRCRARA